MKVEIEKKFILNNVKIHFDIAKAKTINNVYDVECLFISEINSNLDDDGFEYMYLVMGAGLFHTVGNYPRNWMNWYSGETAWIEIVILENSNLLEKLEEMFEKYYIMAMDKSHAIGIEDNEE